MIQEIDVEQGEIAAPRSSGLGSQRGSNRDAHETLYRRDMDRILDYHPSQGSREEGILICSYT